MNNENDFDARQFVRGIYETQILDDIDKNLEYDARDFLEFQLTSYHKLMTEAPEQLRPKIAGVIEEIFKSLCSPVVHIKYKNADLSQKYLNLVKEYNKSMEIQVPESDKSGEV